MSEQPVGLRIYSRCSVMVKGGVKWARKMSQKSIGDRLKEKNHKLSYLGGVPPEQLLCTGSPSLRNTAEETVILTINNTISEKFS